MKKYFVLILLAALLAECVQEPADMTEAPLLTTTAPTSSMPEETTSEDQGPMDAPDFTVFDMRGRDVKLSDFEGKPVVLNFWASWCGPCKREMPDFQEMYNELGTQVQFLMVNLTDGSGETKESASDFIASQGYTFPVYLDLNSHAASAYYVRSIPTTYFISAEGKLIAQASGAIDADTLRRGIDMILK